MNRFIIFSLLVVAGLAVVFGCGDDRSPLSSDGAKEPGTVSFSVGYAPWKPLAAKAAAVETIDQAIAFAFDPDGSDVAKESLELNEGRARGNLKVPAQKDLRVVLGFYEGDIVRYLGETVVDVPARSAVTANITEHYLGSTIAAPESAYVGKPFPISWMKRPFAKWYEVEESTLPDFSDSWSVYSGEDTTFVMDAKYEGDAGTTFYYRARVWTDFGWGPWHGQGKTGVAGDEGTVVIDVPIPPDVPGGGENSIRIVSPNGGEVWSPLTTHDIVWTSTGVSRIKVELSMDGGVSWSQIAYSVDASLGKYSLGMPGMSSRNCLVRLSDSLAPKCFDVSDAPFTTQSNSTHTLTLLSPRGGEVWSAGSVRQITWSSAGVAHLNISLSRDMGMTWTVIASEVDATKGSYSWTLPGEQLPSCLIRIIDEDDSGLSSQSEAVFSIVTSTLALTAPNGGERLKARDMFNITWSGAGLDKATIELSTDSGATWTTVAANVSVSTGSYLWQVPESVSQNCLLRIRDAAGGVEDRSDAAFAIAAADARSITLLAPNGGETLRWYTSFSVRWTATFADMIDLEYSTDNGKTWKWMGKTSAANSNFLWTVPSVTAAQCLLRVTDSTSPLTTDQSDAVFAIAQPVSQVTVTAPNGGESFTGGNYQNITWTSTATDSVRIEFSSDGGSSWQIIEAAVPALSRSLYWKTTDVSSTNCLIRISNYRDLTVSDVSNAPFAVQAKEPTTPRITITAPNGGETWPAGSTRTITWTSFNAGSMVNIDYSTDNGASWVRAASDYSIYSGSYSWKLPSVASAHCLVRVSSVDNIQANDRSDGTFSMTASGATVTVLSPNGREQYAPGSTVDITWASLGVTTVKIDYLYGSNWYPVTADVAASPGKFSWTLPTTELVSKIRIADASNAAVNDESDGYFSVTGTITPTLRLTSPIGGERWTTGTVKNITWTASGIDKVDLFYEFFTGTSSSMVTIATNVDAAAGSYSWTVPTIGAGYTRVKVAKAGGFGSAHTGQIFTVPSIRLEAPNGGENLTVGSTKKITWAYTGISKVKLEYSTDTGSTWKSIASDVWADTKAYTWAVPFDRTQGCLVRITDMETPDASDRSDAAFTIANSITVTQPDGRYRWAEGSIRAITWTSIGVDKVNIEFSKDSGATWTLIASDVNAAAGSHSWTVANIASDNCQFRLTDTQYPHVTGRSMPFAIKTTHGTITLSSPVGGESYRAGSDMNLSWSGTDVSAVKLDLSTDGGRTWTTLASGIPASTTFTQTLPGGISSTNCFFRVMDVEDGSVFDQNDTPFTITNSVAARPASR